MVIVIGKPAYIHGMLCMSVTFRDFNTVKHGQVHTVMKYIIYICVHKNMFFSKNINYTHIYICIYTYICICIYTYMCVCTFYPSYHHIYIYIYTHYIHNIFNKRVSVHYAGLLVAYSFPWGSLGHPRQAARAKANEEKPNPTELQVAQITALVMDFMGFHGILMGFRQEHW